MGILSIILTVLGIANTAISTMSTAEKAFSGKKGSGKAKRKLVLDVTKAAIAKSKLSAAEQKALLKETGKTIDNVAKVSKVVNTIKKK